MYIAVLIVGHFQTYFDLTFSPKWAIFSTILAINRLKLATLPSSAINLGKTKALDVSKLPPSRIVSRSRVVPSTTMMDFASVRCRACLPPTHQDKWSLSPFFGLTEMRSKVDWSKCFFSQQKTFSIVINLTQCGIFMIFLSCKFYVKSILRIAKVQNMPFLAHIKALNFSFHELFHYLQAEIDQNDKIQSL